MAEDREFEPLRAFTQLAFQLWQGLYWGVRQRSAERENRRLRALPDRPGRVQLRLRARLDPVIELSWFRALKQRL